MRVLPVYIFIPQAYIATRGWPEGGVGSLRIGVTGSRELSCGC